MRELLRISGENQQMLKRIQTVRPKYDHNQWEREWQANLQLMDQMSAYPPEWWKNQDQVGLLVKFFSCLCLISLDVQGAPKKYMYPLQSHADNLSTVYSTC